MFTGYSAARCLPMPATTESGSSGGTWRRIVWFAVLWIASLAFWLLVAYGIRLMIGVH